LSFPREAAINSLLSGGSKAEARFGATAGSMSTEREKLERGGGVRGELVYGTGNHDPGRDTKSTARRTPNLTTTFWDASEGNFLLSTGGGVEKKVREKEASTKIKDLCSTHGF